MKITALVFVSIFALGFFVISQKKQISTTVKEKNAQDMMKLSETPEVTKTEEKVVEIPLEVTSPVEDSIINSSNIIIKGTTKPSANIYINSVETKANRSGNFIVTLLIDETNTTIKVVSVDDEGNYSEKEIHVILNKTSTPSATKKITVPMDVFIGEVTSKSDTSFVLKPKEGGNLTIMINPTTRFFMRTGQPSSIASVKVGDKVLVKGILDKTNNSVSSVVSIKNFSVPIKLEKAKITH